MLCTGFPSCGEESVTDAWEGSKLAEFEMLPEFELIDCLGQPFRRADMDGKIWVVNFLFTRCPSVCPALSQEMRQLTNLVESEGLEEEVRFLSITVDPNHDTPEVLAAFAKNYKADHTKWHWVTGESEKIRTLLTQGFHVAMGDAEKDEPNHSTRMVVVDSRGVVRSYHDEQSDDKIKRAIVRNIKLLLNS